MEHKKEGATMFAGAGASMENGGSVENYMMGTTLAVNNCKKGDFEALSGTHASTPNNLLGKDIESMPYLQDLSSLETSEKLKILKEFLSNKSILEELKAAFQDDAAVQNNTEKRLDISSTTEKN
jgi:hypothetical protein